MIRKDNDDSNRRTRSRIRLCHPRRSTLALLESGGMLWSRNCRFPNMEIRTAHLLFITFAWRKPLFCSLLLAKIAIIYAFTKSLDLLVSNLSQGIIGTTTELVPEKTRTYCLTALIPSTSSKKVNLGRKHLSDTFSLGILSSCGNPISTNHRGLLSGNQILHGGHSVIPNSYPYSKRL